jgi:Ca2+-binding EF-hand superfamily protein
MLLEMGLHLHEHDVAQLMKKYDHDHDGEISYGEFCSAMIASDYTDRSKGPSNKGSFHSGADGHEEMTHDEKLLYLQHMKDLKVSTDKKRRLNSLLHEFAMVFFSKGRENYARKAFMTFDVDNSGRVDRYEFACALKSGIGVKCNDNDIALMENAFYGDDIEEIRYQEFIDFVRSHYTKSRVHE